MNCKVNPSWTTANYPFLRAVVIEGSEGMEHHGWKYWKAQTSDMDQLRMELIDIWHFMLSHIILENIEGDVNFDYSSHFISRQVNMGVSKWNIFDGVEQQVDKMDIIDKLELLIGLAVARRLSIPLFKALMEDCNMDWDELYRQYVAKNVLNLFRQDNGYKQGTYRKIWGGREDNEHLVEIMLVHDQNDPAFKDLIHVSLTQRYAAHAG